MLSLLVYFEYLKLYFFISEYDGIILKLNIDNNLDRPKIK